MRARACVCVMAKDLDPLQCHSCLVVSCYDRMFVCHSIIFALSLSPPPSSSFTHPLLLLSPIPSLTSLLACRLSHLPSSLLFLLPQLAHTPAELSWPNPYQCGLGKIPEMSVLYHLPPVARFPWQPKMIRSSRCQVYLPLTPIHQSREDRPCHQDQEIALRSFSRGRRSQGSCECWWSCDRHVTSMA